MDNKKKKILFIYEGVKAEESGSGILIFGS